MLALLAVKGAESAAWAWLYRLGGFGLILLAFLDNSLIPLPGSMDLLTIVLCAHHKEMWWYYAIMATVGSVLGAYPTYKMGQKGGKEALEKKVSKARLEQVYAKFDKYGAWAIVVPALIPPPFPLSPFLTAAGTLELPRRKFFASLALARGVRYFVIAWLGAHYSKQLLGFFSKYYKPILWFGIGLAVLSALAVLGAWLWHKRKQRGKRHGGPAAQPSEKAA